MSLFTLSLLFMTFTVPFIVTSFIWPESTNHNGFIHTAKVRGIAYRTRGTPKHSQSHSAHSLSIIDMLLSVEKPARLSVDLFDEYFSWQTGHLTLHQTDVLWERGRSSWSPLCTCSYTVTVLLLLWILLNVFITVVYIDFTLDCFVSQQGGWQTRS